MAINIKEMFSASFLKLLKTRSLNKITIQSLLDDTGASRQTFYNHFQDKNALIAYIYNTRIIPDFTENSDENMDFYASLLSSFQKMKEYQSFLEQALKDDSPGCLKDYILAHCAEFDLAWHQKLYGSKQMSEELIFATKYHAIASSNMTISWILSGMRVSCEEMAKLIVQMRGIGMDELFASSDGKGNPYRQR